MDDKQYLLDSLKPAESWRIFGSWPSLWTPSHAFAGGASRDHLRLGTVKPEAPYYEMARLLATKLVLAGFNVITGGGPGI